MLFTKKLSNSCFKFQYLQRDTITAGQRYFDTQPHYFYFFSVAMLCFPCYGNSREEFCKSVCDSCPVTTGWFFSKLVYAHFKGSVGAEDSLET